MEQNKIKLAIELVPSSAFFSNLRSILNKADWDILRKSVYKKANYKCEICGGKGDTYPVCCHEVWIYDDENHIQKLSHCQALCDLCHESKHLGLAEIKGNGERAKATLMRVNGWNEKQMKEYVADKFIEWYKRSKHQWVLDLKKLSDYGMEQYIHFNFRKDDIINI